MASYSLRNSSSSSSTLRFLLNGSKRSLYTPSQFATSTRSLSSSSSSSSFPFFLNRSSSILPRSSPTCFNSLSKSSLSLLQQNSFITTRSKSSKSSSPSSSPSKSSSPSTSSTTPVKTNTLRIPEDYTLVSAACCRGKNVPTDREPWHECGECGEDALFMSSHAIGRRTSSHLSYISSHYLVLRPCVPSTLRVSPQFRTFSCILLLHPHASFFLNKVFRTVLEDGVKSESTQPCFPRG
jgi:hypothetical protein